MNNRPDTHWTRILHYDLFAGEGVADAPQASHAGEDAFAPDVPPTSQSAENATSASAERVPLTAADGYPLVGIHYPAAGTTLAHLVVAGAIGVPQRFYRRFAEFAAAHGFATTTLDYRGIGLSAPATLQGFRMDYFDWGRLDLAAAVAASARPGMPLFVVGHSFGGHTFGVLPNHRSVTAFCTFGTGAGWHGWMAPLERLKVLVMWRVLGPLLTRGGYLAWSRLGMGEDLPLGFYRRWKHWCSYPRYFFDDPSMQNRLRGFEQVRAPLLAVNSIDDPWAPPASRDAFVSGYRNAQRQMLDIDPADVGMSAIGHLGYFKRNAVELWEVALAWLDACRSRGAANESHFGGRRSPATA
jgi:predicted alpha/beta hydrolase